MSLSDNLKSPIDMLHSYIDGLFVAGLIIVKVFLSNIILTNTLRETLWWIGGVSTAGYFLQRWINEILKTRKMLKKENDSVNELKKPEE